jgi:hypothetical protein
MTIDKDTLVKQSEAQANPHIARPQDFVVEGDDAPPFHGQHGATEGEYRQLLKEANDPGKSPFGKKS